MADKCILLDHGSGGLASQELISSIFVKHLDNPTLRGLEDSAVLDRPAGRIAFTTDSYVVDPIFFPGGDIGMLAVHGTINDLAMRGAQPLCLSLGLILEEGMALADLERIVISIAACSRDSGVPVVTGDTKVVPRGKGDKIFINFKNREGVKPGDTFRVAKPMPVRHPLTDRPMGDVISIRGAVVVKEHLQQQVEDLALARVEGVRVHALRAQRREHAVAGEERDLALGRRATHEDRHLAEGARVSHGRLPARRRSGPRARARRPCAP